MDILKKRNGFTLLEILMVIIIIGILAALAIPQYLKVVARGKAAEAISNIGTLKSAEVRYYAENHTLLTGATFTDLDVEDPNNDAKFPDRKFTYNVTGSSPDDMVITATPIDPSVTPYITKIEYTGTSGKIKVYYK